MNQHRLAEFTFGKIALADPRLQCALADQGAGSIEALVGIAGIVVIHKRTSVRHALKAEAIGCDVLKGPFAGGMAPAAGRHGEVSRRHWRRRMAEGYRDRPLAAPGISPDAPPSRLRPASRAHLVVAAGWCGCETARSSTFSGPFRALVLSETNIGDRSAQNENFGAICGFDVSRTRFRGCDYHKRGGSLNR